MPVIGLQAIFQELNISMTIRPTGRTQSAASLLGPRISGYLSRHAFLLKLDGTAWFVCSDRHDHRHRIFNTCIRTSIHASDLRHIKYGANDPPIGHPRLGTYVSRRTGLSIGGQSAENN